MVNDRLFKEELFMKRIICICLFVAGVKIGWDIEPKIRKRYDDWRFKRNLDKNIKAAGKLLKEMEDSE